MRRPSYLRVASSLTIALLISGGIALSEEVQPNLRTKSENNIVYAFDKQRPKLVEQLRSDDREKRKSAYGNIVHERRRLIEGLIYVVRESGNETRAIHTRRLAVELLGEMRADEAIPVLVKNIDWAGGAGFSETDDYILDPYPQALALTSFGRTVVSGIVLHLKLTPPKEITAKAVMLYAHVLLRVYENHRNAIMQLEFDISNERDASRKENLDRVLVQLGEITKNWR